MGRPNIEVDFGHPVGETDSTLVHVGQGNFHTLSLIVFRHGGRTRVESLNVKSDFDEGDVNAVARLAAWSRHRLCTFVYYPGGTGNSEGARVFQMVHGKWRLMKHLEAFGENVWDGGMTRQTVVSERPVEIRDSLTVRRPAPGLEDRGSHSAIWLDYRQVWRFSNGQLRQTTFRLLETPAVAVYGLFHLVDQHRRREFDRRVPTPLRRRLWRELLHVRHEAYRTWSESRWRDENPNILVGGVLPVTLTKQRGKWRVTHIGNRGFRT